MSDVQDAHSLFIDGDWVRAHGDVFQVLSPSTENVLARVTAATTDDVDLAVAAARRAFDHGPWPRMSVDERFTVIGRLRELLVEEQENLAGLVTDEMGCPISQSRSIQAANPIAIIDMYRDVARDFPFAEPRTSRGAAALVEKVPVGVVGAITPWNVPLGIPSQKIIPALVAGCTVVLKPAPQTTLDAYELARLFDRAGLPSGVLNVVAGDVVPGERLVSHPGVDKVTFTGSTAAGRRIARLCGQDLRRVTLELGGKSAAIFLEDADLEESVEALRLGSFRNNGQICTLKTRLLVPLSREVELIERLVGLVESMPVGDPRDDNTQIGPLFSARHRDTVEKYMQAGVAEGAKVAVGGGRPGGLDTGWFVEPTVFTGVNNDMVIGREEIFGPVVSVMSYQDEDEAVRIANDSPYGLSGAVFSQDADRAVGVARRLRTGVVEVNGRSIGLRAPFGGFKSSGIGRENGREGLDSYTETRSIGLPLVVSS